ncbi:FxSxx-COOH system tetratricopeptide repeat protein [Streptomyces sp. NC-S4]
MQGGLAAYHIDHVTYQSVPRGGVSWPHQVGVLPRRAGAFLERTEAHRLRDGARDTGRAVQVLVGMGGVGKTQIAADHARRAWSNGEVDLLVWVTAASRQAVISAYAQAAVEILGADPTDPEQAARAFLAWLEPKPASQSARWLIVLDDVADPGDLRELWPPAHPLGRTVIATRRRDAVLTGYGRLVPVGLFSPEESLVYLEGALSAYGRGDNTADLVALAGDLGRLPLALSQAAAYLGDSGLDAAAYRIRLADRARQLDDLLPEPGTLPDDQSATVAAAWSLSLEYADRLRPAGLARPMLQLTAMLDPNGIPHPVLTHGAALTYLSAHRAAQLGEGPVPVPLAVSEEEATGALRTLHRLNLIDHDPEEPHQAVRVHQVVQRATRDSLDTDHRDRLARTAANALTDAWPELERDTDLARALRANATALVACAEDALYRPEVHGLLFRLGESLGRAGQVSAAVEHFLHLADSVTCRLGPNHPAALNARGSLGTWQGEAGDAAGAATAYTGLLEDYLRVMGHDHPETLSTRSDLIAWRSSVGEPGAAAAAYTELLEDCLRILGGDHPETLTVRSHLASCRGEAGDPGAAAAAYTTLLEDYLRVMGPDHPHTLNTRSTLAAWEGRAGNAAAAAGAFAALLEDCLRVMGPGHPRTLGTRNNVAYWLGEAGDPGAAAAAYADLLEDYLQVMGPDHPETLGTRSDLARWQGESGDAAGAAAAYTGLLEDYLRVMGPDHPHTLAARGDLARWQERAVLN